MSNTLGRFFRVTTFGESHGPVIGVTIDGCPAGLDLDMAFIQKELDRRRPGQSKITTQRKESDRVNIVSGVFEGRTTGTPLTMIIENEDARGKDYKHLAATYRPSHADFTYQQKYGTRDYRGGGRSSARETANWVAAGAIAKTLLKGIGIECLAFVSAVGTIRCKVPYSDLDLSKIESNMVRCPDPETADLMLQAIEKIRKEGDTLGGTITGLIRGAPVGLGEPVFGKLHAVLAQAMMSINAVKGFEYGSGFEGTKKKGSEQNDIFEKAGDKITTKTNYSGGIQGGISNGQDIYFKVGFKPVATLMKDQQSVDAKGDEVTIKGKGRHDPCVVPRAVPIVEALSALVLADFYLISQSSKLGS